MTESVEELRVEALERLKPFQDKIELTAEMLFQKTKLGIASDDEMISTMVYCYVAGCLRKLEQT